jgi:hypothetical protein
MGDGSANSGRGWKLARILAALASVACRNPCGQTSNILMSTNTDGISNVTIKDNLLAGGGYSLYCNAGPDVANETVTGNRFSKRFYATGGYWGPTAHCEDADVFSGNVWDESGASLSIRTATLQPDRQRTGSLRWGARSFG